MEDPGDSIARYELVGRKREQRLAKGIHKIRLQHKVPRETLELVGEQRPNAMPKMRVKNTSNKDSSGFSPM